MGKVHINSLFRQASNISGPFFKIWCFVQMLKSVQNFVPYKAFAIIFLMGITSRRKLTRVLSMP